MHCDSCNVRMGPVGKIRRGREEHIEYKCRVCGQRKIGDVAV